MSKIIEVIPVKRDYMECTACFSTIDVKEIKIGNSDNGFSHTTTIKLCSECMTELIKKFAELE